MWLCSKKKHQENQRAYVTNTIIFNSWHDPTVPTKNSQRCEPREVDCSLQYGAAPNIHSISTCKSLMVKNNGYFGCWLNTRDRSIHISVCCRKFYPNFKGLKSTEFAKNLRPDRPALQCVKMDHATATYKLCKGLSVYQQCLLIKKLKKVILALT